MKYIFAVFISLFSTLLAAEPTYGNGIEVIGKASVKAEADQFIFTVSINEHGGIASKTKALVDQKSRLVTDLYLAMGIDKSEIDSARLQLTPRYEKQTGNPAYEIHKRSPANSESKAQGKNNVKAVIDSNLLVNKSSYKQERIYFEVSRTIKVTFTDFNLYDRLLDNVVKIGVSRISPLQTNIVNSDSLYQQALIKALQNANQKAQAIAKQIGVDLGELSSFKESSYHTPRGYMMNSRSNDGFNSEVAQQSVSAQVSATFTIK